MTPMDALRESLYQAGLRQLQTDRSAVVDVPMDWPKWSNDTWLKDRQRMIATTPTRRQYRDAI